MWAKNDLLIPQVIIQLGLTRMDFFLTSSNFIRKTQIITDTRQFIKDRVQVLLFVFVLALAYYFLSVFVEDFVVLWVEVVQLHLG